MLVEGINDSKERFDELAVYLARLSPAELENLDRAVAIQLGLGIER